MEWKRVLFNLIVHNLSLIIRYQAQLLNVYEFIYYYSSSKFYHIFFSLPPEFRQIFEFRETHIVKSVSSHTIAFVLHTFEINELQFDENYKK